MTFGIVSYNNVCIRVVIVICVGRWAHCKLIERERKQQESTVNWWRK